MIAHIKAWNSEYKSWRGGHYSLGLLDPSCKKGRLLDAGCGGGRYTLPLRMRGFDVVALDVSLNALRMAGKRSADRGLDTEFLAANIYEMPFQDASFDIIWCYGVLQHLMLKERELAIRECRRILKKEGLLFIEVLGEDDMRYGGIEVEHNTFSRKSGVIYHYFNKNELNELLKGFSFNTAESRAEKRFNGEYYIRHMISAVAKKL
ncbi:methyltransferase family protein [Candidatus Methanoperedens nitroreducens]|uniref:Methyltransferase family protein n=1 Tax=Candidatus Methanoperedens nitratireducens TaxID=1392998 RepID=A0A062UZI1_9EURY|nr:class I SAM-dependent methyltransferase [Candidatus Methanoperedens nitroreducens]KCZ70567.1 methyltransferase family protein [Candidatus Methanoperedens nitroreducens]MDJ1420420.1 class I SAM-dependent methyltransferase [Candidatus Methanoperedens sp.]